MKKFFSALLHGLGYFGIFFGVNFIVSSTILFVAAFVEAFKGNEFDAMALATEWSAPIVLIYAPLAILIYFIIFKVRKLGFFEQVNFKKIDFKTIILMLLVGVSMQVVVSFLMGIIPFPEEMLTEYADASSGVAEFSIPIILATVIFAPIVEEIAFRGLVLTRFQKGMPILVVIILQAILFGAVHGQIIWMCFAGFMGIVMGYVAYRYNSITPSIILHIANNAFTYVLQLFNEENEWIYSYILIPVGVLVFIVSMIYIYKKTAIKKEDEFSLE